MFFANEESLSPEEFLIETTKHHLVAAAVTRPSITRHSSSMGTTHSWDMTRFGAPCLPADGVMLPAALSAGSGFTQLPVHL